MKVTEMTTQQKAENQIIRFAPYCRVSSSSEDQLHSFAAQIKYYKDYERSHPDHRLVDIYADEGLTGTSMKKRDDFNRLIRDCKKGKIDRIITKSISRFARNTTELLTALRMLKEIGVSVYFEEQGIDTDKMNMEMIVTFPGMAAQQESETISGNMRWSYKKRMESGEFNCCYPAYGFRLESGNLIIYEPEAEVVRRIFAYYLRGCGMQRIANMLNSESDLPCPQQGKWSYSSVRYVLNNERYMGDTLHQKKYTTDTLPFKEKYNHGERPQYYVENSNPAIVSRETFLAARTLQRSRASTPSKPHEQYLLRGYLRCPECGRVFRRIIASEKAYWVCSGKNAGETTCRSRRVKEDIVYETFTTMIWKLKDNRDALIGSLIHGLTDMQSRDSQTGDRIRQIDKEIADLTAQNYVLAKLQTKGVLSTVDFSAQADELNSKIRTLRAERRKVLAEDECEGLIDTLTELNDILSECQPSADFDEDLFQQIVESITVDDSTQLTFKLMGDLELTEKIQEKGRCKTA